MKWTRHAREQFEARFRGEITRSEVERKLREVEHQLDPRGENHVILKDLERGENRHGSSGDRIVVSIDGTWMGLVSIFFRWQHQRRTRRDVRLVDARNL